MNVLYPNPCYNEVCYNFGTAQYVVHFTKFIRERSGSVVECLTRDRGVSGFETHRRRCIVSLSKTHKS